MGCLDLPAGRPVTRFFVRPEQIIHGFVLLDADDAHHLRTVLHAQPGDRLAVLDGFGQEWPATLTELGKTKAVAQLGEPMLLHTEPAVQITVAQALPKMAEKIEQVMQRGTEIGVSAFWAFESERSLTHLVEERQEKRRTRWEAILKTAAEQAHRAVRPALQISGGFADVLTKAEAFDLALLADTGEARPLKIILQNQPAPKRVLIVIGPESGLTAREVQAARKAGAQPVSLGPRILRTETAALVLASQLLYALE